MKTVNKNNVLNICVPEKGGAGQAALPAPLHLPPPQTGGGQGQPHCTGRKRNMLLFCRQLVLRLLFIYNVTLIYAHAPRL